MPVFALVNTAILIPNGFLESLSSNNSMGIIIGLALGKFIGIFSIPFILVKVGYSKMQVGMTWKKLAGIGFLGGIGFTMSMFITNLAFENPLLVNDSKLSILVASAISAVMGLIIFFTNKKAIEEK